MKSPATMTNDQIQNWMGKTSNTLGNLSRNQSDRTTEAFQTRVGVLTVRWADIQEEMVARGIWEAHCEEQGMCPSHNAGDCMA